jgi:hypothetical protein
VSGRGTAVVAGRSTRSLDGTNTVNQLALSMVLLVAGAHAESNSWEQRPSSDKFPAIWSLPAVPSASIYEVAPTKIDTANVWHLNKSSVAEIPCDQASFLTSGHFSCETEKKPYLVRAVFVHGGTERFTIHYEGSTLFVHHGSLGRSSPPAKNLPLIVNLPFMPTQVYPWASVAE